MVDLNFKGKFFVRHFSGNKLVYEEEITNMVVDEGKKYLIQVALVRNIQPSNMYIWLKGNSSPISKTDTASQCLGASGTYGEIAPSIIVGSQGKRVLYVANFQANNEVSNLNQPATFEFAQSTTVYGAYLTTIENVGSTTGGILFSAANFPLPRQVQAGDILQIVYTIGIP